MALMFFTQLPHFINLILSPINRIFTHYSRVCLPMDLTTFLLLDFKVDPLNDFLE